MMNFPFRSRIPKFVKSPDYIHQIEENLVIFISRVEHYLQIKISEEQKVCESFISHVTRLIERIYSNSIILGEPSYTEPEVEKRMMQHRPFIVTLFETLFPHVQLSSIEIYFISIYFYRLEG